MGGDREGQVEVKGAPSDDAVEVSVQAPLPFDGLLAEALRDAADATRVEAKASARGAPDVVPMRNGHPVGSSGPDRLWSFELTTDITLEADSPAKLDVPDMDPLAATVLAVGDASVIVGVREELGESVPSAQLSVEAGFILERLAERLDEASVGGAADPTVLEALLLPDAGEIDVDGLVPTEPTTPEDDQARAAERAVEAGLRFTWGPPGTGKTRVLAEAADLALVRDQRVLVLAHANAAVDVAISRIADTLAGTDELEEGRVLRVGTPHAKDVLERGEVLPASIAAEREPGLAARRADLVANRRTLADEARSTSSSEERRDLSKRLKEVRTELAEIDRRLAEVASELVDGAALIATTLSRAILSEQIWRWPADVVMVDEASMVGLPFLLALASRGPTTLSCFGDFRQLPPICISETEGAQHWFSRDVFEAADVISTWEAGRPDDRLAILRTQFRMGEQICETVNRFAYDGILRTHDVAARRGIRLAEAWPESGVEVVVVDVSDLGAACLQDPAPDTFSRSNPLAAALDLTIAENLVPTTEDGVAVVSPYRLQVRLLDAVGRRRPEITSATTHRFQGGERDAVVFDLVDAAPYDGASRLTGTDADRAQRLLNVAASRARGKLVFVVDRRFVEDKHPLDSPARRFIECAMEAGAEGVSAIDLINEATSSSSAHEDALVRWESSWSAAIERLSGTLGAADEVDVNVPSEDLAGRWLEQALADRAGRPVTLRAPAPLAKGFDLGTQTTVKLATVGPAPWLTAGSAVVVGSTGPNGPAAVLSGPETTARFRQVALGET